MLSSEFRGTKLPIRHWRSESVLVEKTAPAFNMKAGERERRGRRREIATVHGSYDIISGQLQLGVCGGAYLTPPLLMEARQCIAVG